jgi:hypothetical protein
VNCLARERAAQAMFQENDMQPKSIHGADAGFRVLDQDAASDVVQRQMRPTPVPRSSTSVTDEQNVIRRRADQSIDFDFYRRRAAAPRARAPRETAMWISAVAGALMMAAFYVVLFLAAAQVRAANDVPPMAPAIMIPGVLDAVF